MTCSSRSAYCSSSSVALKGLDEMMRQLGDEADGIGQQDLQMIRHLQAAGRRVQRVKQPVVGRDARAVRALSRVDLPAFV